MQLKWRLGLHRGSLSPLIIRFKGETETIADPGRNRIGLNGPLEIAENRLFFL